MKLRLLYIALVIIQGVNLFSQSDTLTFDLKLYPFIHKERNEIVNTEALHPFFQQLREQKAKHQSRISILHIGDSHIQADFISAILRTNLQKEFGNAGRGLITPLRVAGSNEPFNYKTSGNIRCDHKRCVFIEDTLFEYGIGGHTVKTDNDSLQIRIKTFDYAPINYGFNKFTLFHLKDSSAFSFVISDTSGNYLATLDSRQPGLFPNTSETTLPQYTNEIILSAKREDSIQTGSSIFGMMVQNDSSGIMLHTVGVNGAEAFHFVNAKYFAEQTQVLYPSFIIISLGTNEAQRKPFDKALTTARLDSLVKILKFVHPDIPILLTTPPDSYYARKYYNPSVAAMHSIIVEYAKNYNLAVWDLFSIAGGYKSCYQWKKYGLLRRDGVHFTRAGYDFQGGLLYKALVKAYNEYVLAGHP